MAGTVWAMRKGKLSPTVDKAVIYGCPQLAAVMRQRDEQERIVELEQEVAKLLAAKRARDAERDRLRVAEARIGDGGGLSPPCGL